MPLLSARTAPNALFPLPTRSLLQAWFAVLTTPLAHLLLNVATTLASMADALVFKDMSTPLPLL